MTIGAVSSTSRPIDWAYTNKLFGYDRNILILLRQYGIQPSGSQERDIVLLKAKIQEKDKTAGANNKNKQSTSDLAWNELFTKLGLTATGDRTQDYNTAIKELEYRIKYASTDSDRAYYQDLYANITTYFPNETNAAQKTDSNQYYSASNILSELNRQMIVNKRG